MPGWAPGWLPDWQSYCLIACLIRGGLLPAWEGLSLAGLLGVTALPAWEEALFLGRWETACITPCLPAWETTELLPSPGGRWATASLPAWEATNLWEELSCVDTPVIFPSFLFSKLLNLFSCLCLTLVNLISPTFLMKPWHSLSLCVDKIDANCDPHSSVCLPTLSRILFIALTLAWSKSFSAFWIKFLAFSVFMVDFSLILTGIKSLCIHLKVKVLWFYSLMPSAKVPLTHTLVVQFDINFSFCWLNLVVSW